MTEREVKVQGIHAKSEEVRDGDAMNLDENEFNVRTPRCALPGSILINSMC
jgi:hypothetical protein